MAIAIVVETGAGLLTANSYVSVADADLYHATRLNTGWTGDADARQAALIRATAFIDGTYRSRFPGLTKRGRMQGLEWPRIDALLPGSRVGCGTWVEYLPDDAVPREIAAATCEAALREIADPGALAPDLERGGAIQRIQAGSVAIEYAGNAQAMTSFQAINLALASLLVPYSPFSGRAVRG